VIHDLRSKKQEQEIRSESSEGLEVMMQQPEFLEQF
jgi:hypothetical protein